MKFGEIQCGGKTLGSDEKLGETCKHGPTWVRVGQSVKVASN